MKTSSKLKRAKHNMPDGVHQCVHDGGSKNALRLAPRAAIKYSCNRREDSVAPVWEDAVVGDVCEAENSGGTDPTAGLA